MKWIIKLNELNHSRPVYTVKHFNHKFYQVSVCYEAPNTGDYISMSGLE